MATYTYIVTHIDRYIWIYTHKLQLAGIVIVSPSAQLDVPRAGGDTTGRTTLSHIAVLAAHPVHGGHVLSLYTVHVPRYNRLRPPRRFVTSLKLRSANSTWRIRVELRMQTASAKKEMQII